MNRPPPAARLRPSRRTSFARRDSNLALLGALIAGAVIAFALLLLLVQRVNPDQGSRLRGATADILAPVITVVRLPFEAVRHLGNAVATHWQVVERNRALEAELAQTRARAERADHLAAELARLESLVGLTRPQRRIVAAGVASANVASAAQRTATISVGSADGVRPRMPVIAAGGLAGRVTDTGRHAARILLLTDPDSRVPVTVVRTGWTGLAVGTGGSRLDVILEQTGGTDQLRTGDRLVTSGDGGLFPPGVPVAVIVDSDRTPPAARPLANPASLGPVVVEAPWLPPPATEPTLPAPPEPDRPVVPAPPAATAAPAPASAPGP